jgi:hypothetical protein
VLFKIELPQLVLVCDSDCMFEPTWVELYANVIVARRLMQSCCTKIDVLSFPPFLYSFKKCSDMLQSCSEIVYDGLSGVVLIMTTTDSE